MSRWSASQCLLVLLNMMRAVNLVIMTVFSVVSVLEFSSSFNTQLESEIGSKYQDDNAFKTGIATGPQQISSLGNDSLKTGSKAARNLELEKMAILVELAMALTRRYFAVCAVLLHPYDPHQLPWPVFNFLKLLALCFDHRISVVAQNFRTYPQFLKDHDPVKCSRTINIIYGDERLMKEPFAQMTYNVTMAGPLWLIILHKETSIAQFLEGGNLPFDVDLVVAQRQSAQEQTVILHEAYRASLNHPVRVLPYGHWSQASGLVSPPHVSLYYRRNDFEGVVFKVATAESYPIVRVNISRNGTIDISGYFGQVWKDLESRLNFSSVYVMPGEHSTGTLRDGRWTGVTGMVTREHADVGVASLTLSAERSAVVDFLRPLVSTRNNVFFRKPGLEIHWDAIFRPFETGIWVTLLVWILLGSIFLTNMQRVGVHYSLEPEEDFQDFTMVNSLFSILRAFSQQGMPKVPKAAPGRILVMSSYLVSVVILTAYSGALISFIAVEIPRVPFRSLGELVKDQSYTVQVVKDTAAYMYFANASDPVLNAVFKMMRPNLPITNEEALRNVCKEQRLVHFGPQAPVDLFVKELNLEGCDIMALPYPLNSVYISIIIQKKNQYRDALNHHLDLMSYQGLLGRLRQQLWPNLGPIRADSVVEVRTEQVVPVYMVLIAGIILALAILSFEKLRVKRLWRLKNEKKKKSVNDNQLSHHEFLV